MQKRCSPVLGLSMVLILLIAVPAFAGSGSSGGGDKSATAVTAKKTAKKKGKWGKPGKVRRLGNQGPLAPQPPNPGTGPLRIGEAINILNPGVGRVLITQNEGFAWFGQAFDSPDACAVVVVNLSGGNNAFIASDGQADEDLDEGDEFTVAFNTGDGAAKAFGPTIIYGTPQGPEGPLTTQLGIGATLNNPEDVGQGDCHLSLNLLVL